MLYSLYLCSCSRTRVTALSCKRKAAIVNYLPLTLAGDSSLSKPSTRNIDFLTMIEVYCTMLYSLYLCSCSRTRVTALSCNRKAVIFNYLSLTLAGDSSLSKPSTRNIDFLTMIEVYCTMLYSLYLCSCSRTRVTALSCNRKAAIFNYLPLTLAGDSSLSKPSTRNIDFLTMIEVYRTDFIVLHCHLNDRAEKWHKPTIYSYLPLLQANACR